MIERTHNSVAADVLKLAMQIVTVGTLVPGGMLLRWRRSAFTVAG